MTALPADLIEAAEAIRARAVARAPWLAGARLAGIGWATVELERAARELDPGGAWAPTPRDALLGASCWRHVDGNVDLAGAMAGAAHGNTGEMAGEPPALLLLEPDTEGPLAASLARFGEGVAAIYLGLGNPPADLDASDSIGLRAIADGPLGRGSVLPTGSAWGPHVVVLDDRSAP